MLDFLPDRRDKGHSSGEEFNLSLSEEELGGKRYSLSNDSSDPPSNESVNSNVRLDLWREDSTVSFLSPPSVRITTVSPTSSLSSSLPKKSRSKRKLKPTLDGPVAMRLQKRISESNPPSRRISESLQAKESPLAQETASLERSPLFLSYQSVPLLEEESYPGQYLMGEWLDHNHFSRYRVHFFDHEISLYTFPDMQRADYKDIGICKVGVILALMRASQELASSTSTSGDTTNSFPI